MIHSNIPTADNHLDHGGPTITVNGHYWTYTLVIPSTTICATRLVVWKGCVHNIRTITSDIRVDTDVFMTSAKGVVSVPTAKVFSTLKGLLSHLLETCEEIDLKMISCL